MTLLLPIYILALVQDLLYLYTSQVYNVQLKLCNAHSFQFSVTLDHIYVCVLLYNGCTVFFTILLL